MSATPTPKTQSTLDAFDIEQPPEVRIGEEGEPIPPEEVAGYVRQDSYHTALFRSPTRVESSSVCGEDALFQRFVWVAVKQEPSGGRDFYIHVFESREAGAVLPGPTIGRFEDDVEAVEAAVEWMDDHPAPADPETIRRLGFDGQEMDDRDIGHEADAIREGTTVYVDGLPPATVIDEREPEADTPTTRYTQWECETETGESFELLVEDTTIKPDVLYTLPGDEETPLRPVARLTSCNEQNLRESVDVETYQWLKNRQGEAVVRQATGEEDSNEADEHAHRFEVVEVNELRDGFVNPTSDGELDPSGRKTPGIYVDGSDEWFEIEDVDADLEPGPYRVLDIGIVENGDAFGADPVIDADDAEPLPFIDLESAPETESGLSNPLPDDRPGLSRDDPVDELIGVGEATVEKFWRDAIGELYDAGWPAPYIGSQYDARAVADLYTVPDNPTRTDALKAAIGMLGAVGFDAEGEKAGTAASAICGKLSYDEIETAWLSSSSHLKSEYCPSWFETVADDGPVKTFGVGSVSRKDIGAVLPNDASYHPIEEIRPHPIRDGIVGLLSDDGDVVSIPEKPLRVAATVAMIDLQNVTDDAIHVGVWDTDDGSTVFLTNVRAGWNVVLDTSGVISVDDVEDEE